MATLTWLAEGGGRHGRRLVRVLQVRVLKVRVPEVDVPQRRVFDVHVLVFVAEVGVPQTVVAEVREAGSGRSHGEVCLLPTADGLRQPEVPSMVFLGSSPKLHQAGVSSSCLVRSWTGPRLRSNGVLLGSICHSPPKPPDLTVGC